MGETAEKLLQQHIEEDRISFAGIKAECAIIEHKIDALTSEMVALQTEFKLRSRFAGSVIGFLSGIGGAVIVALLT